MEQIMPYIESDNLINGRGLRLLFKGLREEAGAGGDLTMVPDDNGTIEIFFQFAPKVTSDGRKADWKTKPTAAQTEPIVTYASSQPREFTWQWTYIYDGNGPNDWGVQRITRQLRRIRGYFQRAKQLSASRNMVALVLMWAIGGPRVISCRIISVDTKYSDTMIWQKSEPNDVGVKVKDLDADPDYAFPLKTEVTCTFAVWTAGALDDKSDAIDQSVNGILRKQAYEWY
jgi:hypothetical protein